MHQKIAFLCNWGNTPGELLIFLARQTPGGRGIWGGLQGVASPAEAHYLVVLEDLPSTVNPASIDLQRTIFLPREPAAVRARKKYQSLDAPLAFSHDDIYQAAVWRVMRPFEEMAASGYAVKPRPLSTVTSAVSKTPGHRVRIQFLSEFARRYPGVLDVYGYGWKDELGGAYKGEVGNRFAKITDYPELCKLAGLSAYRYSLAFENCRQRNYFSEKVLDCWLAWSMPIYWGCLNLSEYFPEEAFHAVDPSSPDCVDEVAEIVARPIGKREIDAMNEARQLILRRYNIWPTIEAIISGALPSPGPRPSLVRRVLSRLSPGRATG